MSTIKYTEEHEWVEIDGENVTIGITEYAQEQLGDVVFVELPDTGRTVAKGDEVAVVESVKAASEVYAPVSGEITEANSVLDEAPATVNEDAIGAGWFVKMKLSDTSELEELLDEAAYQAFVAGLD